MTELVDELQAIATEGSQPDMSRLFWVDYVGFTIQSGLMMIGTAANGFIIWVLSQDLRQSPFDIIQMTLAVFDSFAGLVGSSVVFAARFTLLANPKVGFNLLLISFSLITTNIILENLITMLTSILRTWQVNSMMLPLRLSHENKDSCDEICMKRIFQFAAANASLCQSCVLGT